jgi:ATP synthase F1 delta subunit
MQEIAVVYARSLFEVAREDGDLDVIRDQLNEFADALAESRDLRIFFFSPYFSSAEKEDGLERAVDGAHKTLTNFLRLLIENHRMPVVFRVRQQFEVLWADEHKLLPVEITSAIELDKQTIDTLGERIGEQTGRQIELNSEVDPEILGGIVLRVGNSILDASIRNRLEQLRKQLAAA